jgi:hypothetical protein
MKIIEGECISLNVPGGSRLFMLWLFEVQMTTDLMNSGVGLLAVGTRHKRRPPLPPPYVVRSPAVAAGELGCYRQVSRCGGWHGLASDVQQRHSHAEMPPRPTRREFSIINIRLNTVERGYQAKAYKFNRKDDAVFRKES